MHSSSNETATSEQDPKILATLFAWEDLHGRRPRSWGELEALGSTLNRSEATQYVINGGLPDARRSDLYCSLFQYHPELRSALAPQFPPGPHHFIARLSERGGPNPADELFWLVAHAKRFIDAIWWLPLKALGNEWRPEPNRASRCIILAPGPGVGIDTVVAEIVERRATIPKAPAIRQFFGEYSDQYRSWWRLARPIRHEFASLDAIPGRSRPGKTAAESFGASRLSFAYWELSEEDYSALPTLTRPGD
jgi:hypothetical protein